MALLLLGSTIKMQDKVSTNNRVLLNNLFGKVEKYNMKKGAVFQMYQESALFYCEDDIKNIAQRNSYKAYWITKTIETLSKSPKWRDKPKRVISCVSDNLRHKDYINEYNYSNGKARLLSISDGIFRMITDISSFRNELQELDLKRYNNIADFVGREGRISYESLQWLREMYNELFV